MKILYVANHKQPVGNADEEAIAQALRRLGHKVLLLEEKEGHKALQLSSKHVDVVLFHKWNDVKTIRSLRLPTVFWYFDLVDFNDETLAKRCESRKAWMNEITPMVDIGFCTDGDWVARDKTNKLMWLPQGADERFIGFGNNYLLPNESEIQILFTGIKGGGVLRTSFVDEMESRWGSKFTHVSKGVHQKELKDLIARSKIVVAPDGPVTNNYWSNRVYLTLGFGGFLIHPYCEKLKLHYDPLQELPMYRSREELHSLISYYLSRPSERLIMQEAALAKTAMYHTYTKRLIYMLRVIQERGILDA